MTQLEKALSQTGLNKKQQETFVDYWNLPSGKMVMSLDVKNTTLIIWESSYRMLPKQLLFTTSRFELLENGRIE